MNQEEILRERINGDLRNLFIVTDNDKENIDKTINNLKPNQLSENEWKKLNTTYQSLTKVPRFIEDTYRDIKGKLDRVVGFGDSESYMIGQKEALIPWISKILGSLEGVINLAKSDSQETLRRGSSSKVDDLCFDLNCIKNNIEGGRPELIRLLDEWISKKGGDETGI